MITYNHESFIEQAVTSVISQSTDSSLMLFIGEDMSTDSTREICLNLKTKHPDRITLFLNDENLGVINNAAHILQQCIMWKADYISFLEGDDYWTDPLKLQKQVNLLKKNPKMSMVFTNAHKLVNGKLATFFDGQLPAPESNLYEFIHLRHRVATATVVVKSNVAHAVLQLLSENETRFFHLDYLIWCVAAKHGSIGFITETTAVYRVHANSMIRKAETMSTLESGMRMNKFLADYLGPEYRPHFLQNNWWYYLEFAYIDISVGRVSRSMYWLVRSLWESVRFGKSNQLQIVRDYLYRLRNRNSN
jgi:glycosyltransferase involved in cell wall biosynthesis